MSDDFDEVDQCMAILNLLPEKSERLAAATCLYVFMLEQEEAHIEKGVINLIKIYKKYQKIKEEREKNEDI